MARMPDDDLIDETQFTCPSCGSSEFGTTLDMSALDDESRQTGHCHGMVGTHPRVSVCGFSWKRSDDEKYFKPTGRKLPRTHVGTVESDSWPPTKAALQAALPRK